MSALIAAAIGALLGLVVGAVATTVLWAERARRIEQASQGVDYLSAAIEQVRSVAAVIRPDGRATAASPLARRTGLITGTRISSELAVDMVTSALEDQEERFVEIEIEPDYGAPSLLLALRAVPLPDGACLLLGEDRSQERRFETTRREFSANVTHELKTPIGAIVLLAEAAATSSDDPDAVAHFAGKIQGEANRLNELVSQIIAISRLQSDDPLWKAVDVDLKEIVNAAVVRTREQAKARKVSVTTSLDDGCHTLGDPDQLEAAVTNLITNAITHSGEDSRVVVSLRRREKAVEIMVSDTGVGISAQDLERVFERFYRVDSGRGRNKGGTGLGLSIVKHVATAHGGQVTAWSKPGQGSTFTITLPDGSWSKGNE